MGKDKGAVVGFGKYLSEEGKSWKTIESYVGDVAGFLAYLERMETEFDGGLRRFQITSYRSHLLEEGYEASTINKKINSLQAFNRWLVCTDIMTDMVVDLRKDKVKVANGSEKQVEVLSEKQLERLLFCIQGQKVCVRDKAVVLCMLYTGVVMYEYYQRKISEAKTKVQALVCVMRRLVNIVYGMMKRKTEYVMPKVVAERPLPEKMAV